MGSHWRRPSIEKCTFLMLALTLLFLVATLIAAPSTAFAREFSVNRVDIDATISSDGSLSITETREFALDGSFNGVFWVVETGDYEGRAIEAEIVEAGEIRAGAPVPFRESSSGEEGTYQLASGDGTLEVKLYTPHSDETTQFYISYVSTNLVSRWEDTAELYWKFVPEGWECDSSNVTCTVHLPVPDDEAVTGGENVRAWGHGPLDGNVSFSGNDVAFTVPEVASGEFAEARIAFPTDWVAQAPQMDESRLEVILDEEQQWADEANAKRSEKRNRVVGTCGLMGALALGSAAYGLIRKRNHAKAKSAAFSGDYYRDVPSDDHPTVLSCLYSEMEPESTPYPTKTLPASIMRLADIGAIKLDTVFDPVTGKPQYRLTETGRGLGSMQAGNEIQRARNTVDHAAMRLLFDTVAENHRNDHRLEGPNGERYVLMSDFEDVANRCPETFKRGIGLWNSSIKDALKLRQFMTEVDTTAVVPAIVGIADGVLALVLGFAAGFIGAPIPLCIALAAAMVAAGVFNIKVELKTMYKRSPEAEDILAKLQALNRWFKDFTNLREAIPTDVIVWNRLLVTATALGTAREVIKQLKVKVPNVLASPQLTAYRWYERQDDVRHDPMRELEHAVSASNSIINPVSSGSSEYSDSSSNYSSGSGSGGGFSSGGGGGFGGRGGGGAF